MSEDATPAEVTQSEGTPSGGLRTRPGRAWMIKTVLLTAGLFGFGLWGAYDAFSLYPARGEKHERFMRMAYLAEANAQFRLTRNGASIVNPREELDRLSEGGYAPDSLESRIQAWLTSLSRLKSLSAIASENEAEMARREAEPGSEPQATATLFVDPQADLELLVQELAAETQPKPLTKYDIPLQYAFMIGGLGGALLMVIFAARVLAKSYRYDPVNKRLTLPNGKSFLPENMQDVDKRKWDKFLVFITLDDGSPEMRLDLYRYQPLEEWILEMEKLSPNYEPPPEDEEEDEDAVASDSGDGGGDDERSAA
ncbi:MAG: hypothetical protein AAFX05_00280 [Planctomycetota bacterium]